MTLTFSWTDTNVPGIVDSTSMHEANLRVWHNGKLLAGPCSDSTFTNPTTCAAACKGLHCCCDPTRDTWTVDVLGFSNYVVGTPEALLIPGGGSKATDCFTELSVLDPRETPAQVKGRPNSRRTCVDGDPLCDTDAVVNGSCAFLVGAYLNVTDNRLVDRSGQPACIPTDVSSVTLSSPKPSAKDPDKAAAASTVRYLFAARAPSTIGGTAGDVVTYTSPVTTADLCNASTGVNVPLNGQRRRTLKLLLKTRTSPPPGKTKGVQDADAITLKRVAAN